MKILKDQKVIISHKRKGIFNAIAYKNFDTNDEFYSVILCDKYVEGINSTWIKGDEIPCRSSLCSIKLLPK